MPLFALQGSREDGSVSLILVVGGPSLLVGIAVVVAMVVVEKGHRVIVTLNGGLPGGSLIFRCCLIRRGE